VASFCLLRLKIKDATEKIYKKNIRSSSPNYGLSENTTCSQNPTGATFPFAEKL
jgi:hypothetical protein